jgi:hypothetical protein
MVGDRLRLTLTLGQVAGVEVLPPRPRGSGDGPQSDSAD